MAARGIPLSSPRILVFARAGGLFLLASLRAAAIDYTLFPWFALHEVATPLSQCYVGIEHFSWIRRFRLTRPGGLFLLDSHRSKALTVPVHGKTSVTEMVGKSCTLWVRGLHLKSTRLIPRHCLLVRRSCLRTTTEQKRMG